MSASGRRPCLTSDSASHERSLASPTPDGNCGFASGTTGPGANSTACAYVYGYDMVQGITAATEVIAGDIRSGSHAMSMSRVIRWTGQTAIVPIL
jgi:hypothetical protein